MISWSFFLIVLHPAYTSIGISALGSVNTALGSMWRSGVLLPAWLPAMQGLPLLQTWRTWRTWHMLRWNKNPFTTLQFSSHSTIPVHASPRIALDRSYELAMDEEAGCPPTRLLTAFTRGRIRVLPFLNFPFIPFSPRSFLVFFFPFPPSLPPWARAIVNYVPVPNNSEANKSRNLLIPPPNIQVWGAWGNVSQHAGQEGGRGRRNTCCCNSPFPISSFLHVPRLNLN